MVDELLMSRAERQIEHLRKTDAHRMMKVSDYAHRYVDPAYYAKFYENMKRWDGRNDVGGAFYSFNVLQTQYKYALSSNSY